MYPPREANQINLLPRRRSQAVPPDCGPEEELGIPPSLFIDPTEEELCCLSIYAYLNRDPDELCRKYAPWRVTWAEYGVQIRWWFQCYD